MEQSTDNIYVLLLIATVAVLLLAVLPVLLYIRFRNRAWRQERLMQQMALQHQQALLRASVESQENERQHIGAELHDHIINSMMLMNLQIRKADTRAALLQSEKIADQLRNISHGLSPVELRLFGLKKALTGLVVEWQQSGNVMVDFRFEEERSCTDWSYEAGLHLYRILQELVNNTIRHANASVIELELRSAEQHLTMRYSDNGAGFDLANPAARHNGLFNIESRLQLLQASCAMESAPGAGFRFETKVPFIDNPTNSTT